MSNLANQYRQDQIIDQALELTTSELATQLKLPIDNLIGTKEPYKETLVSGEDFITYDELVDRWVDSEIQNYG